MSLTGLLIGWRINTSFLDALIGFLTILVFAYSISWVMAYVALVVRSPEVVNNASFIVIFPITFIANTFVSTTFMPEPLATFANWNPVSAVAQSARERFGNLGPDAVVPDVWSLQHPEAYTMIWVVIIIAVFAPLSIRKYQNTASR